MSNRPDPSSDPESADPGPPGLPGGPEAPHGDVPIEFDRAYSVLAYTMNRYLVDHMLRASRHFDHDIETVVLFGVLSHLNVAHLLPPGTRPSDRLARDGIVPGDPQSRLRPARLRDLVAVIGRPRETVRRRLERLHAEGRILKVDDGWVIDVTRVEELRALTLDSARRFIATATAMVASLEDAEASLRRDSRRRPKWANHPLKGRDGA